MKTYFQFQELDDEVFREPREDSKSKTSHSFTRHAQSGSPIGKLFCPKETRIPQGQEEHTRRELGVSLVDSDEEIQLQDFVKKFCTRYAYDPSGENPRPLSSIDPNTLPIPCYQSTEEIISQYTPRGKHNFGSMANTLWPTLKCSSSSKIAHRKNGHVVLARFIRRITVASNAIQTIDIMTAFFSYIHA